MAIDRKKQVAKLKLDLKTATDTANALIFCLEKEKALHRRTRMEKQACNIKFRRALMALYGAAEQMSALGRKASADVLGMIADDMNGPVGDTDGAAMAKSIAQDEQH